MSGLSKPVDMKHFTYPLRYALTSLLIGLVGLTLPVSAYEPSSVKSKPVNDQAKDSLLYELNARTVLGLGQWAPFLTAANAYDRHSITANNLSLWGAVRKPVKQTSFLDYGFGTEWDINVSPDEQRLFPGELYAEAKVWRFLLTGGMKRAVYGNQDPFLSAGGILWSTNARPIPRVSLESMGYIPVPLTTGLVEVKGGLIHGWFTDKTVTANTLLHYKYAGIRLGGRWPVRVNYTLHHVAQWAGDSPVYGHSPANWESFKRVLLARSGDANAPDTERFNTLGNHIISKNLGLEFTFPSVVLEMYWQNIYEDKPVHYMYKTYNWEDGLFGFTLLFPKQKTLSRLVVEYVSTTDQSGPWHDLDGVIYGGQDGYYTNSVYPNGWSFYGMTVGNPWLTSPRYNANYETGGIGFTNNRLRLYHVAGQGMVGAVAYKAELAYSENYGVTWGPIARKDQFSWLIDTAMPCPFLPNTDMTAGFAGDIGRQYGNNVAIMAGLRWHGALSW